MTQGDSAHSTPAPSPQAVGRNTGETATLNEAVTRLLSQVQPPTPVTQTASVEDCPAFRIGTQIGRLVRKHQSLDTPGEPDPNGDRARAMMKIDNGTQLLLDALSYALPTSIPGALAQIVASTQFLRETMQRDDLDEDTVQRILDAAQRCLYGAAAVLSAHTGMSPDLFGAAYIMPRHLDFMRRAFDVDEKGTHSVPTLGGQPIGSQISSLAARYRSERDLYDCACSAEDKAAEEDDKVAEAKAHTCIDHAVRMMHTTLRLMASVPAVSLDDFAHKARVIAHEVSEWWDTDQLDHGEVACRHMLDQLMAAGGLERWPVRDFTSKELARVFLGSASTDGIAP